MEVVELHKYPNLMNECCELLNREWKRSITARMHSLEKSCDSLPVSLILLSSDNNTVEVIGHSRLSPMSCDPNGCLIESVLIKNERRGEGLGKFLMQKTECHAKRLGYQTLYLTTGDKQEFYEHLGYSHFIFDNLASQTHDNKSDLINSSIKEMSLKENFKQERKNNEIISNNLDSKLQELSLQSLPLPLPPPPPPLPTQPKSQSKSIFNREKTYWMKKSL
ncbi:N-alpha-acetyltransferase 80 [Centruroides vittatus]|uniref:N-alpha-acetyltransferase 80 n=1 Tax=Centruroides vittatus TaxID=120091 RepID=UPI003510534D